MQFEGVHSDPSRRDPQPLPSAETSGGLKALNLNAGATEWDPDIKEAFAKMQQIMIAISNKQFNIVTNEIPKLEGDPVAFAYILQDAVEKSRSYMDNPNSKKISADEALAALDMIIKKFGKNETVH